MLKSHFIETPIGDMQAISDENYLYFLEFTDCKNFNLEIEKLKIHEKTDIVLGLSNPNKMIEKEIDLYFAGKLKSFKTPIYTIGSLFQKQVWHELLKIPFGKTKSYKEQAEAIGNINAFRAVANANGANQLAIIVPCHRIIMSNGELGGYGGGVSRKKWLLQHESNFS